MKEYINIIECINNSMHCEDATDKILTFNERKIFMIDVFSTKLLIQKIWCLEHMNNDEIKLYMNIHINDIEDTFAIIDTINIIKSPVSTICMGTSKSLATWILASGIKGRRFATSNSTIMIDQPKMLNIDKASNVDNRTKQNLRVKEQLIKILSDKTGQSIDKIKNDIEKEYYMTAKEAKDYGIIDKII